jgi:hypothetical protein
MDGMNDDRFDEFLEREARSYHEPPPPPRDAMWARIAAERHARRAPATHRVWWIAITGMAATLMLGIGLGWFWHRHIGAAPVQVAVLPTAAPSAGSAPAGTPAVRTFDAVAADHLGRAEALLTSFQVESRQGAVDPQIAQWAGDLLSSTRLLLDSPNARDPRMRRLLGDLEVVLAQMAELDAQHTPSRDDVQLIDHAMSEHDMLTRLRNATPAGSTPAGS